MFILMILLIVCGIAIDDALNKEKYLIMSISISITLLLLVFCMLLHFNSIEKAKADILIKTGNTPIEDVYDKTQREIDEYFKVYTLGKTYYFELND